MDNDSLKNRVLSLEETERALIQFFKQMSPDELQQKITTACFAAILRNPDEDEIEDFMEIQNQFNQLTEYVKKKKLL